jgi:alanine dehydrogenase
MMKERHEQKNHYDVNLEEEPRKESISTAGKSLQIGIIGNYPESDETRFLLTPEACGMLTSAGMSVCMEQGAAIDIDFKDETYAEYGVKISERDQVLKSDIVLSYQPLKTRDIAKMTIGAHLLCMMSNRLFESAVIKALVDRNITVGCFDNMLSYNEEPVFANIIDEIDGQAAIMYAQEALSFLGGGKGVLLGGAAGIAPCEVLIIGDGNKVCSAANAALRIGATVTLMNNDISALQVMKSVCDNRLVTAAIHPKVLYNKVKTADVIIMDSCTRSFEMPQKLSIAMKETLYMLDFTKTEPSVTVPRTVAMAISNVLVNFFDEMAIKGGFDSMLATTPGMQCGIVTYKGKLVDKLIGSYLGMPGVDLSMMLAGTN